jgi:DNA-binding transcriptional LysR family regulator
MSMETRNLQIFLAVAECASMTRAAEMLGKSQPNVTRAIQDLEAEIGLALFQRVGRRIVLTEHGTEFEGEARRMLSAFASLTERAHAIAAGCGRALRIATTAAIGTSLLPEALAAIDAAELPEVQIAQLPPNAVSQDVRSGQAEIGFSSLPLDTPGLEVLRLYAAPDVAVVPCREALAREEVVPLSAFAGRRFVTMLDPTRFQKHVARSMAERGVVPGAFLRTNVAYAGLYLVARMKALGIIDPVTGCTIDHKGVAVRPLDIRIPFHFGVIAAQGRPMRPLVAKLIAAVERIARARIKGFEVLDPKQAGQLFPAGAETAHAH